MCEQPLEDSSLWLEASRVCVEHETESSDHTPSELHFESGPVVDIVCVLDLNMAVMISKCCTSKLRKEIAQNAENRGFFPLSPRP